jgi:hypothetical protein
MNSIQKSAPKTRVVLTWIAVVAFTFSMCAFWMWWFGRRPPTSAVESESGIVYSIVMVFFGVLFLGASVAGYLLAVFTSCLTFNFDTPVWRQQKTKIYFANIFIPLGFSLGLGFLLSAFLSPLLRAGGISREFANLGPALGMIFVIQLVQLWILIWGPLEKRIIVKRLLALGVTPPQLQGAFMVGLSNPAKSSLKKIGLIEEDIGALWVGPEQLVYWGDCEQFGVLPEQIVQIERKADSGSTSMLGGITHVILHVKQTDGSIRQIRFHNEGLLTMGQKRIAMEQLATAIGRWHSEFVSSPAAGQV